MTPSEVLSAHRRNSWKTPIGTTSHDIETAMREAPLSMLVGIPSEGDGGGLLNLIRAPKWAVIGKKREKVEYRTGRSKQDGKY